VERLNTTSSENAHFSDELWTDFVRGLADEGVRKKMQIHLDADCTLCRVYRWIADVANFGLEEQRLEIPEPLIEQARQIHKVPSKPKWIETWDALAAQLVQQAGLSWQPAGVRSPTTGGGTGGRMLFRAGDYLVDLQVESPSSGNGSEIVGQIANEHEQSEVLDGIIVEMVIPGRTLSETATNRFGEFVLECPPVRNAILRFGLRHRKQRIELPLDMHV